MTDNAASNDADVLTTPQKTKNSQDEERSQSDDRIGHSPVVRSGSLCKLSLTPSQIERRRALVKLAAASNLGLFHNNENDNFDDGDLRLSRRGMLTHVVLRYVLCSLESHTLTCWFLCPMNCIGVAVFALASAFGYYLLRLVSRDLLSGFKWYKALAKRDSGIRMFELYLLSIVNAGILTGYSVYKLSTNWRDTTGCKRLLASVMGYFIHDFIAVRSTWREDIPTVIHHVFGIALVAGLFGGFRVHLLVATV